MVGREADDVGTGLGVEVEGFEVALEVEGFEVALLMGHGGTEKVGKRVSPVQMGSRTQPPYLTEC